MFGWNAAGAKAMPLSKKPEFMHLLLHENTEHTNKTNIKQFRIYFNKSRVDIMKKTKYQLDFDQ